jgi:hypothetical protein
MLIYTHRKFVLFTLISEAVRIRSVRDGEGARIGNVSLSTRLTRLTSLLVGYVVTAWERSGGFGCQSGDANGYSLRNWLGCAAQVFRNPSLPASTPRCCPAGVAKECDDILAGQPSNDNSWPGETRTDGIQKGACIHFSDEKRSVGTLLQHLLKRIQRHLQCVCLATMT